jgi:hypothetical protein
MFPEMSWLQEFLQQLSGTWTFLKTGSGNNMPAG